jgi:hypothetical protein
MSMDTLSRKQRIQDISRLARFGCMFLIAAGFITVFGCSYVLWTENGYLQVTDDSLNFRLVWFIEGNVSEAGHVPLANFSVHAKFLFTLSILLIYGLILKGLYHMQRLFFCYSRGMIFTTEANSQMKQIGVTVSLGGVVFITGDQLMKNAINFALNENILGLRLHFPDHILMIIIPLLVGATIMCISWVMETGREIREDQELTI